ncbi:MAG: hypothetical protein HQL94_09180 [Magnetococcales bacterium]|nr:hypothetical protein [Magnetococcales bacterium]MBF0437663.1 hypothetical protein [Magnetococcales bacterium]
MLTVVLPDEIESRVQTMARVSGQSVDECIQEVFGRILSEMDEDDISDANLIHERANIWEQCGHHGITLEEYANSRGIGAM